MWLSKRDGSGTSWREAAQVGNVTVPGDPAGVALDGERRNLPVFGPGGYVWRPYRNQEVLVVKAGADGELPCVAGVRGQPDWNLSPGEVYLYSPGASVWMRSDGVISMSGKVLVNGYPVMVQGV